MTKKDLKKKGGFIVSAELILISTILVIGLITGLVKLRNSVVYELVDVGEALGTVSQTFEYTGLSVEAETDEITTLGSVYQDQVDDASGEHGSGGTDLMDIDSVAGSEDEALAVPAN